MKLKGLRIDGVTYLVSESEIEKHGTLEKACQAAKVKRDEKLNPKPVKAAKVKKKVEQPQPEQVEDV
jgi:hypothetical protein